MKKPRLCYLTSLAVVIALSVYPIYMGIVTLSSFLKYGFVKVEDYPKYIIPYTPLCLAVILVVALMPPLVQRFKRWALLVASFLGVGLFIGAEIAFEQIKVIEGYTTLPLDSWQYSLCYATPEVLQSIGEPIYAKNNPAYKIHYYIIALIILLAVINTIFGLYRMVLEKRFDKKKPLFIQAVSVAVFVALCILACFTAFWRNGTLNIEPLSAVCMMVFFIVFGITSGTTVGSLVYGRGRLISSLFPAVIAMVTTVVMYIGELVLTGGKLFCFGKGFLFMPMGSIPFAWIDFLVILLSGVLTYSIMRLINRKNG